MDIRLLRADEIECRVQTVKEDGCSVLLYKDARCDMKILDEVFGPLGWEREHQVINGNLFCTVRVWDKEKNMWISKQDVGTESMTEKEKGQASDSFKRACFNLGIGRELYTSPFVWINLDKSETYKQKNGKLGVKTRFKVSEIGYNEKKEVNSLKIKDNKGKMRFTFQISKLTEVQVERLFTIANKHNVTTEQVKKGILRDYNKTAAEDLTKAEYDELVSKLERV